MDKTFFLNLCLVHFLLVYTYQNSDNDKNYNLLGVSINIGNKILNKYFNVLRQEYIEKSSNEISYLEWVEKWKLENTEYNDILDDSLRSALGCKVIDILCYSEMLKKVLTVISAKQKQYVLEIVESKILVNNKRNIINLPTKLPMIVPPKPYSKNVLGGYLLNNEKFSEPLFIEKKGYGINSELSDNNKIYDMINQINSTPFKINTVLLDYIMNNWERHNLLFDPKVKHKFEDIEKRTKYQNGVYNSHISKIILQETILGIAQFFSNFNEIYFPVRLDQRGRLYCSPNFMNYQANELSKALLIFSKPGIIKKDDMDGITYLKAYGANCYGNKISKSSTEAKLEWVNQNIDNILNYDNGVLLNKSKDKLLFLAFCIEYKRFYDFYTDENLMEFETYLPIQLDATCNGFQHMALLSNEDTLFKELNLVSNKSDKPNDFYNFLVHKLKDLFDKKILEGEFIDNKTNGSYERLSKFIWDRSYIKKAIMTIPYNSSVRSMRKYISDSLVKIDHDEDNSTWYSDSEKNTKIIINNKDIALLTLCLMNIIQNDFEKIKKLSKYLKNVATLLTILELPISWTLPTGLIIKQSYLETKSTTIPPFTYSKIKLNLRLSIKDKYDKNKQVRALMPNLIHSLDGSSLSLLFNQFSNLYNKSSQFYSVHDCFGTTCDKVFILKTILASVYTDIYSSEPYLYNFDKDILDNIEKKTNYKLDRKNRTLEFLNTTYTIHDIDWVTNKKQLSNKIIKAIDSQYILI